MTRTTAARYGWLAPALFFAGFLPAAHASTIASLQDWCGNIDGQNVDTNFCNQGGAVTVPANVNASGFDFTLGSSSANFPTTSAANNLGSITFTLSAGANQFVLMYMDYDLNYNAVGGGSYNDTGSAKNALPANESYELNDPNTSSIFSDFATNTLSNTNSVGVGVAPGVCCDVSWALGLDLNVAANTKDLVTFSVSTTAPASGFYLKQTNSLDPTQNIYMQALVTVQQTGGGGGATPEPASYVLIAGGLAGAFLLRRKMTRGQNAA